MDNETGRADKGLLPCVAALVAVILSLFAGCSGGWIETGLVIGDIAAGEGPSSLKALRPPPERIPVSYMVSGRAGSGDLYLPAGGPEKASVVLVPGIVAEGKDDSRIAAFAMTLARTGSAVLVPEIRGFRDLVVDPAQSREVADAFLYLSGKNGPSPGRRTGIAATSFAVGLAILAALEPDIRDRVGFLLGIGGYFDLEDTLAFMTTGRFTADGTSFFMEPDPYGRLVFALSSIPRLADSRDRETLRDMVRARLRDQAADISGLAKGLGPEGRAVYDFLENRDPDKVPLLLSGLPDAVRDVIAALNLGNKDLSRLSARVILAHGKTDPVMPFAESIALAGALGEGRASLFLLEKVLLHVELDPSRVCSRGFWREDIPDMARLFRAVHAFLGEMKAR